jgi:hypothetical protein
MAEEFIEYPEPNYPDNGIPPRPRRSVCLLMLGRLEDVNYTIAELHLKQFGEVGLWSPPLRFSQLQEFALNPGEVMRVYKRYLTQ